MSGSGGSFLYFGCGCGSMSEVWAGVLLGDLAHRFEHHKFSTMTQIYFLMLI